MTTFQFLSDSQQMQEARKQQGAPYALGAQTKADEVAELAALYPAGREFFYEGPESDEGAFVTSARQFGPVTVHEDFVTVRVPALALSDFYAKHGEEIGS